MLKNKNIPSLRFSGFTEEWELLYLGNFTEQKSTNSFSRDMLNYEKGEVYNIHYGDIHTKFKSVFDINNETVPFINEDISLKKIDKQNYCQEGDLVFADASEDYNDIGKCIELKNLNGKRVLSGLHTILYRPQKGFFAKTFLVWVLQSPSVKLQIKKIAQGTKVLSISSTRLSKVGINFPSFQEQQKIASFLTAVDEKIQQLTQKKQLLDQYKKGLMQKIFNREIRFKDENGKDFPEWEPNILANIGTVIMGQSPDSKSYNVEGDGYYLIQGNADIKDRKSAPKIWTNEPTKLCEVGDLLLSVRAPVGSVAVSNHIACIGRGVCAIRSNEKKLLSTFLFQYLVFCESKWIKIEQGSTFTSINSNDIKTFFIPRPSMLEQNKISSFLSKFDKQKEFLELQIREAISWKKGLLQQMFV